MIFGSVLCAMRFLMRDRFAARDLVFSPPPDLCLISPPLISRSVFLCLVLSFSPVALRNKGAGAIPDLRSEAQTSLLSCMVIVVFPGALLDGAFSCANILAPGAPAWKKFSKSPIGLFEDRRFFPRLRRFVLCSCRRQGRPTIKPGGDERMCDYLPPSAAELLVSLARESEQLKIKIGQLEKDNAALKAKLSELEKSLKAQEA